MLRRLHRVVVEGSLNSSTMHAARSAVMNASLRSQLLAAGLVGRSACEPRRLYSSDSKPSQASRKTERRAPRAPRRKTVTPPVASVTAPAPNPIAPPQPAATVAATEAASAAEAARKGQQPSATTTAATAAAPAKTAEVERLPEYEDAESFFSSLADPTSSASRPYKESTLVYNALTGRLTSETSATIACLRKVGFGINDQRQVFVEHPEVLNAFAARIRAETDAVPATWPATLRRSLGSVLANRTVTNPAEAVRQMMQVKINSVMHSRYASVVSSDTGAGGDGDPSKHQLVDEFLEETITLNEEQNRVIDIALRGHHIYIGGSAGTGKTVLLRALSRRLQAHRLRVAMTATTGVAGCHIGGSTLHHAFGISARGEFIRRGSLLDYDVIIIDEVSMLPQRLFEDFDRVLREEAGTPDLPFGGVQIILCGDFMQLGAINELPLTRSKLFHECFVTLSLQTQVRQSAHPKFAKDLQLMRRGIVPGDLTTTVQQLPPGTMVDSAVNLLPTNKEVHAANEKEMQRLEGDPLVLSPETGITSLRCEATATLLLRTQSDFNEVEFAKHVRALLQATLDLPRASLLSLYRVYEDGHAMRVVLPPGESVAWREAMRERFIEIAGLLNDLELGATVTEIVPTAEGLHTPESEEYLQKLMSKHPIAQPLTFKKGCRVLLRANLSSSLVNGSIGTVVDFAECKRDAFPEYVRSERLDACIERYRVYCLTECSMPIPMVPVVRFYNGEVIAVPPWEFTVGGGPNTHYYSLSSVALPLSLAYAFTVHKVQGLTLVGRVHLELSRMWPCAHLLYVAMSRVRNPEQLSMSSFQPNMVVASPECVAFDCRLRSALQVTDEVLANFPVSSWKRCNDTIYHLRRRGASLRHLLDGASVGHGVAPATSVRAREAAGHAEHAGGSAGLSNAAAAAGVSVGHLQAIEQSVLVARRMRKLVKHVERVAKLNSNRRKGAAREAEASASAPHAPATSAAVEVSDEHNF